MGGNAMNVHEKRRLSREAAMQLEALKKISRWKMIAMGLSTLGVAAAYAGLAGVVPSLFLGIFGVILTVISAAAALIINLGLKNGRRNVEKILNVLEGGRTA